MFDKSQNLQAFQFQVGEASPKGEKTSVEEFLEIENNNIFKK